MKDEISSAIATALNIWELYHKEQLHSKYYIMFQDWCEERLNSKATSQALGRVKEYDLPVIKDALNDLSAMYGTEFDSVKFQAGAKAMHEYLFNKK